MVYTSTFNEHWYRETILYGLNPCASCYVWSGKYLFNCIFQRKLGSSVLQGIWFVLYTKWKSGFGIWNNYHTSKGIIKIMVLNNLQYISLYTHIAKAGSTIFTKFITDIWRAEVLKTFGKLYLKEPICSRFAVLVKIYWNWMCSLELSRNLAVNIFNNNSEGCITRMVRDITLNYFIMFVDIVI